MPASRRPLSRPGTGRAALPRSRGAGLVDLVTRERQRDPLEGRAAGRRGSRPAGAVLSGAQAAALATVTAAFATGDPTPLLLDGPTGAGKTAVYAEAIGACLAAGRPALVLVPEIALALPLVDRLRADLGAEVAVVHSGLGEGERADAWRRIRAGVVDVVVGTRTAVLAPLADVGLVVVDEEHEATYKSDRTPRIQARDVAVRLGALAGAPVILGSATPSVESEGRARLGTYRRATLPDRAAGAPPAVELVDLREELAAGNRGLLSGLLARRLAALDRDAGERAILVINRRGAASAVLCRDCGHVQACPECTRPLVYHQAGMTLRCHHCGAAAPMASRCPACRSPRIRFLGRRHGAAGGRGARPVPGAAGRAPRPRRRGAPGSGGPGRGRLQRRTPRRPGRHEPRHEGPGHPRGDARGRRLRRRRPDPARRAGRRADLPAPRAGDRACRPRRAGRPRRRSRPTSPSTR